MKGFVRALTSALLAVLLVGGVAFTLVGAARDTSGGNAATSVLTQVEEEEDAAADSTEDTATVRSPIDELLAMLSPSAEGTAFPSAQRVVLSRDPFRPVVPEPAADGGADDGGTDDGDGADGDGDGHGDGADGDGDGTEDGTDVACTGDEQETVCDGVVVTLDAFGADGAAIVSVNGTTFTVSVGQEFAGSFRVLAINDPCATLLFGDESFSICVGATVLK